VTENRSLDRFAATVASLGPIRASVDRTLRSWGCDALLDDALLCASELSSNAILHTRAPFELTLAQVEGGVRIEVVDQRPRELPAVIPDRGIAMDITSQGTTGRGLQIVASLADRWGVTATTSEKAVWVELRPGSDPTRTLPITVAPPVTIDASRSITLRYVSLPVRAAVASGMQIDGMVRELQLEQPDGGVLDRLYGLLDTSAPVRLEGRRLALQASSEHRQRYDLTVHTSRPVLGAVRALNELVEGLADRPRATPLADEVLALRSWLGGETARQLQGLDPTACGLP
jgi:anti-sigma regulatory factor (Ser/Thr protein kinase)